MSKQFIIKAINKATGEFVQSETNNVEQRLETLKYNIKSINGQGTAVFDRFECFIGTDLSGVEFEIYERTKVVDGTEI
jgi:hypothetical protein